VVQQHNPSISESKTFQRENTDVGGDDSQHGHMSVSSLCHVNPSVYPNNTSPTVCRLNNIEVAHIDLPVTSAFNHSMITMLVWHASNTRTREHTPSRLQCSTRSQCTRYGNCLPSLLTRAHIDYRIFFTVTASFCRMANMSWAPQNNVPSTVAAMRG